MEVAELLASAEGASGTDHYGPDAEEMLEALAVLVGSVNEDAALGAEGEAAFAGLIESTLTQRLLIEQWYARHVVPD